MSFRDKCISLRGIAEENTKNAIIEPVSEETRLAICISGHMRKYHNTVDDFFKNVVNIFPGKIKPDIFICTYSQYDHSGYAGGKCGGGRGNWEKNVSESDIRKVYGPKDLIIFDDDLSEAHKKWAEIPHHPTQPLGAVLCTSNYAGGINQFNKMIKCMEMLPDDIHYDVIMKYRSDIISDCPFPWDKIDLSCVNTDYNESHGGVCDRWWVTTQDKHSRILNNWFDHIFDMKSKSTLSPEGHLMLKMEKEKLNVRLIKWGRTHLLR